MISELMAFDGTFSQADRMALEVGRRLLDPVESEVSKMEWVLQQPDAGKHLSLWKSSDMKEWFSLARLAGDIAGLKELRSFIASCIVSRTL